LLTRPFNMEYTFIRKEWFIGQKQETGGDPNRTGGQKDDNRPCERNE